MSQNDTILSVQMMKYNTITTVTVTIVPGIQSDIDVADLCISQVSQLVLII